MWNLTPNTYDCKHILLKCAFTTTDGVPDFIFTDYDFSHNKNRDHAQRHLTRKDSTFFVYLGLSLILSLLF